MRSHHFASILAVLLLGAPFTQAHGERAPTTRATSDVFHFKIGALDAFALKDGDIDSRNDGKTYGVGQPTSRVAAVLAGAGLPADPIRISIQPLLVKDGKRLLLFDTGAGNASFAKAGRLPTSLRNAGFTPGQVTDIFISHKHPDHVGGLVSPHGGLAFPNAVIHVSTPEWTAMKADHRLADLVAAIAPKVETFAPDAVIVPSTVTAIAIRGHTSGHTGYAIASGDQRLIFIGDVAHHSVISVQKPDWRIQFDEDDATARASRRAFLKRAAEQKLRLYAGHFPFPGLGRIQVHGDGFIWVPER